MKLSAEFVVCDGRMLACDHLPHDYSEGPSYMLQEPPV